MQPKRVFEPEAMSDPIRMGTLGEWLVYDRLVEDGHDVLAKNWRTGFGEVDLVTRKCGLLHMVEVKSRVRHSKFRPEDSVTGDKIHKYRRLAKCFLKRHRMGAMPVRYLIATVEISTDGSYILNMLENAF